MYSNQEKFDMLKCFIQTNENSEEAGNLYFERFPERRQPFGNMFTRIKSNLITHGSFGKPRARIYDVHRDRDLEEITVLGEVYNNRQVSVRQLEAVTGIPRSSVHSVLKKHKFKAFRTRKVHHLYPRDFEPRMAYSNWFLEGCNNDQDFPLNIMWTDESHVTSNGIFNRYNSYAWAQENPHITVEMVNQGRFGFNVWAGVLRGRVIGPYIFDGNLNHDRYQHEILEGIVEEYLDNLPVIDYPEPFYFQHDGAPSHTARAVTRFLTRTFGNNWIGNRGPVHWPARSPDLTLCDFYLWGRIADQTFRQRPENRGDLEDALHDSFDSIGNLELMNAARSATKRCRFCLRENGRQFEHLLT